MIILDVPVDGLEWFEAKNWKSMTYNYKDASFDSLTLRPRPCHWPPRHVSGSERLPPAPSASSRWPRP